MVKKIKKKKVGKKENKNLIYDNFKFSLKYLKKIKTYFWFSLFLFLGIAILGYFFPNFFTEEILRFITELIEKTQGMNAVELIGFIMANNIFSAFSGWIFGIFLGIFPLMILIVNGYVLGFVSSRAVESGGVLTLWRLFPHGIFEIPAIMISIGLGLRLGISMMYNCIIFYYKKRISNSKIYLLIFLSIIFFPISLPIYAVLTILKKELREKVYFNFSNSLRVFIFIIIPLLVIAAIIEGLLIYFIV